MGVAVGGDWSGVQDASLKGLKGLKSGDKAWYRVHFLLDVVDVLFILD